jgi:hypothetical protein
METINTKSTRKKLKILSDTSKEILKVFGMKFEESE